MQIGDLGRLYSKALVVEKQIALQEVIGLLPGRVPTKRSSLISRAWKVLNNRFTRPLVGAARGPGPSSKHQFAMHTYWRSFFLARSPPF